MSVLGTIIVVASAAIGQAAQTPDPHLQPLSPLIGTWRVDFDVPDLPIKEATVTYQWILNGKYLEARWHRMDGTELGPELFTWDPISKTIRMWGFDPFSFYQATWQIEGKKWTGTYAGTKFTGERTKDTLVLEFESDSIASVKSVPDGSGKPTGTSRFQRVNVEEVGQLAHLKHLTDFAKDFAGEWLSEVVAEDDVGPLKKGDKYTAHLAYKWSPDSEALFVMYSADIDGKTFDTTKGIVGWDAAKKAIVLRWFDSLGATGEVTFSERDHAWHYDWASTDATGAEYRWTSTVTFEPGIQRVCDTNRKIKGEARPDFHLTWTRK